MGLNVRIDGTHERKSITHKIIYLKCSVARDSCFCSLTPQWCHHHTINRQYRCRFRRRWYSSHHQFCAHLISMCWAVHCWWCCSATGAIVTGPPNFKSVGEIPLSSLYSIYSIYTQAVYIAFVLFQKYTSSLFYLLMFRLHRFINRVNRIRTRRRCSQKIF